MELIIIISGLIGFFIISSIVKSIRKKERELIRDYKQTITGIGTKINKSNYETAVKIASIPDQIRGFGHVKEKNIKEAINYRTDLLNSFHENT